MIGMVRAFFTENSQLATSETPNITFVVRAVNKKKKMRSKHKSARDKPKSARDNYFSKCP